jgi:hypothetical protein
MKIPKYALYQTVLGWSSLCYGSIETSKLSVSVWKQNNRNKRFVSDSAETGFGSSFGCFESKLVSKDTLAWILYEESPELMEEPEHHSKYLRLEGGFRSTLTT